MAIMWACRPACADLIKSGIITCEQRYVPRAFTWFIKSYFFMPVCKVPVKLIALALLIKISTLPNSACVASKAFRTLDSSRMSTRHGRAFPPAASISSAAV